MNAEFALNIHDNPDYYIPGQIYTSKYLDSGGWGSMGVGIISILYGTDFNFYERSALYRSSTGLIGNERTLYLKDKFNNLAWVCFIFSSTLLQISIICN